MLSSQIEKLSLWTEPEETPLKTAQEDIRKIIRAQGNHAQLRNTVYIERKVNTSSHVLGDDCRKNITLQVGRTSHNKLLI